MLKYYLYNDVAIPTKAAQNGFQTLRSRTKNMASKSYSLKTKGRETPETLPCQTLAKSIMATFRKTHTSSLTTRTAPLPGCNAICQQFPPVNMYYQMRKGPGRTLYIEKMQVSSFLDTRRSSYATLAYNLLRRGKYQLLRDLLTNLFSIPCPKPTTACYPSTHYAIT